MQTALLVVIVALAGACDSRPKVKLVASSCADFASCNAECDQQIVVACDRGAAYATDAATRAATYRKSYGMWSRTCDLGNPEACLSATHTSLLSRGMDPRTMSGGQIGADKEACEYYAIYMRAQGTPLTTPCP